MAGVLVLFSSCGAGKAISEPSMDTGELTVTSTSINSEGKLLTKTAANRAPNSPTGSNESPQVSWNAVDGCACYAVMMFDTDANWLHWVVTDITKTSLEQGEYTDEKVYVGPYPPSMAGRHNYRIEVFALKQAPAAQLIGKLDTSTSYDKLVSSLDQIGGKAGNILARGHITGSYANGDDTQ